MRWRRDSRRLINSRRRCRLSIISSQSNNELLESYRSQLPNLESSLLVHMDELPKAQYDHSEAISKSKELEAQKDKLKFLLNALKNKLSAYSSNEALSDLVHNLGKECEEDDCDEKRLNSLKTMMEEKRKEVELIKKDSTLTEDEKRELLSNLNFESFEEAYSTIVSNFENVADYLNI